MDWIATVITAALTVITGALLQYVKKVFKDLKSSYSSSQEAQLATLRYQIVQARDYFTEKGSIGKYSLDCIEYMFRSYEELGGNGFILDMMNDIRSIPVK